MPPIKQRNFSELNEDGCLRGRNSDKNVSSTHSESDDGVLSGFDEMELCDYFMRSVLNLESHNQPLILRPTGREHMMKSVRANPTGISQDQFSRQDHIQRVRTEEKELKKENYGSKPGRISRPYYN
ncbi:hypothetical protein C922_04848 [Plasmodium inui San Antonio 1]|uniref:Uncharacterized protein n=1 Tax=Plasmodium inui San Antonio 1 TaxID=1237626 RepID=W6ZZW2_9APIC|nr:hypothetical protein C922_04848 [Plasmodium inui San Antonio 1]EUD64808.1 hypothetical protein C922_04848 [Plasmodium inui San Antonio 1]